MKRLLTLTAIALCAGMLIAALFVQAGEKIYDDGDLDGQYYFVSMQQRIENGLLKHCSGYGTIEFDGAGTATLVLPNGEDRCDGVTGPAEPHGYTYAVNPDGSFLLTTDVTGEITHCQILDKGRIILCDGTSRDIDTYAWIAIGIEK